MTVPQNQGLTLGRPVGLNRRGKVTREPFCHFAIHLGPWYRSVMTPQLSPELREAIAASPDHPVRIEDEETQRVYFVVTQEQVRSLLEAELRRELQVGYDDIARGDVVPFDAEDIRRRGMERLQRCVQ